MNYGLETWGNDNYFIEDGKVKLKALSQPAIVDIVKSIREQGHTGPLLMRFPHLIEKQIN